MAHSAPNEWASAIRWAEPAAGVAVGSVVGLAAAGSAAAGSAAAGSAEAAGSAAAVEAVGSVVGSAGSAVAEALGMLHNNCRKPSLHLLRTTSSNSGR